MAVMLERLLDFASRLEGEPWATLARRAPFRYHVRGDGIEFISDSGAVHPASRVDRAAFCEEFNRSGSFTPRDYSSEIDYPPILVQVVPPGPHPAVRTGAKRERLTQGCG
jgi:hypothetical protein